MADIRIKDLPTTATQTASDDFIALDGTVNGTRKIDASAPSFKTSVTSPSVVAPASTALTLTGGSTGASLVLGSGTTAGAATLTATGTGTVVAATAAATRTAFDISNTSTGPTKNGFRILGANASSADSRQWSFTANDFAYGDLSIRQSSAAATDPLSGTSALYISAARNLLIGTTTDSGARQVNTIADSSTTFAANFTQIGLSLVNTNTTANNWLNIQYSDDGTTPSGIIGHQITDHTNNYGLFRFAVRGTGGFVSPVIISPETTATSTTTGALQVTGGVGVSGAGYFGGAISATSTSAGGFGQVSITNNASAAINNYMLGSTYGGTTFGGVTGNNQAVIEASSTASSLYLGTGGGSSIVLAPNRTAALTLASGGAATFSGNLTVSGTGGIQLNSLGNLTWGGAYGAGIPAIAVPSAGKLGFYPNGSTSGLIGEFSSTGLAVTGDVSLSSTNDNPFRVTQSRAVYNPQLAAFLNSTALGGASTQAGPYITFGVAQTTNNAGQLMFGNFGGLGSAANTVFLSIYGATHGLIIDGAGTAKLSATTPSTGSTSGALQVAGGIYAGAASVFGSTIATTGTVGVGVTPKTWASVTGLEIGNASIAGSTSEIYTLSNAYYNAGWKYKGTGIAQMYAQDSGGHSFKTAASGVADGAITFTNALTLATTGAATFAGAVTAGGTLTVNNALANFGNGTAGIEVRASGDGSTTPYGYWWRSGGTYEASMQHQASTGVLTLDVGRNAAWGGKFDITVDTTRSVRFAKNLTTFDQPATFAGAVTIAGTVIHTLSATPASASATGVVGTMSWDANYIYICTATNTWKRVAIATW